MENTLVIENVDLDLLEEQRIILNDIVCGSDAFNLLNTEQREALIGILGMLDHWSDAVYFNE
jgi:hypothetical protein